MAGFPREIMLKFDTSELTSYAYVSCTAECKHNAIYKGSNPEFRCDYKSVSLGDDGACLSFEPHGADA